MWLDNWILNQFDNKTTDEYRFSEYTKSIFEALKATIIINEQQYQRFDQQIRRRLIQEAFLEAAAIESVSFTPNSNEMEIDDGHIMVSTFIERTIKTLSTELSLKAISDSYLEIAELLKDEPNNTVAHEQLDHYEECFEEVIKVNFPAAELIFAEIFKHSPPEKQKDLIELLNSQGIQFEPRKEYFEAAKKSLKEDTWRHQGNLANYYPGHFTFCSRLPQDDELKDICFDNLSKLQNISIDSSIERPQNAWLEILGKFDQITLNDDQIELLEQLLEDEILPKDNVDGVNLSSKNTKFILKILMSTSNLEVSQRLEDLLTTIIKACNEVPRDTDDIAIQVTNAILLLSQREGLTAKNHQTLSNIANDFEAPLASGVNYLLGNQPKINLADKYKVEINSTRANWDKALENPVLLKESMKKLAFLFSNIKDLNYLLFNNFGESTSRAKNVNRILKLDYIPYIIDGAKAQKEQTEQWEHLKNEFLNFLLFASSSADREVRKLAHQLFFLFPDEIIAKGFHYISNINQPNLVSVGVRALEFWMQDDRQSFLQGYLYRHPEIKENFKLTNAYNSLKPLALKQRNFGDRLHHFEESLQSLGFRFRIRA